MAIRKTKRGKRYRLEVYFRMGQRMRLAPFLLALFGLALLVLIFVAKNHLFGFPEGFVRTDRREFALALIFVSVVLYVVNIIISRISMVQPRSDHLFVRAGILSLVIAYERVRSLRSVQVGRQYPPSSLKPREYDLMEPFLGAPAVGLDLTSYPVSETLLRRLWSKFLFLSDGNGLMFVVRQPVALMQEIDEARQTYLERKSRRARPSDLFERVAEEHRKR